MKKIAMVMAILLWCSVAQAQVSLGGMLEKLELKTGVGYSMKNNEINALATIPIVELKNGLEIEVGYSGDSDESDHSLILAVSYPLVKLKDVAFVKEVPLLNLVELNVGAYAGYGRIDFTRLDEAKADYGPSLTLLDIHF